MDSARSGQENRQYAGSSSMFGILQDAHMRSVREHNVVAPQRNDMVQAATASAAQNRQAFLKQKQLLQAGSGVHATMHADGPEWHRQRAPKVLSKEDAVSHLHQAAQDRLDLPVDADTGKHVPSAKIVTVRRHLMCGGTGPNTADDRTEGNAVLHSRWKSKFAEIGAKPGHGDLASATDRAPNRGGDEVSMWALAQSGTPVCLALGLQ